MTPKMNNDDRIAVIADRAIDMGLNAYVPKRFVQGLLHIFPDDVEGQWEFRIYDVADCDVAEIFLDALNKERTTDD